MDSSIMKHCVYIHKTLSDNSIFYVGRAVLCQRKKRFTRPFSSSHRSEFWRSIVNKHGFIAEIVSFHNTKDEADAEEIRLIAVFGKRIHGGILCNMANGGQGNAGAIRTRDWRGKMSKALIGRKLTQEHKDKLRAAHTGRKLTEEHKRKIGQAAKLAINFRLNDPDVRAKAAQNRKGIKYKTRTREHQDKINKANTGQTRTEEARLKMSIAAKNRYKTNARHT